MPFGLARYRGLAEPFHDPLPRDHHLHHHRLTHRTGSGHATRSSSSRHGSEDDTQSHSGILPEDVIVIILGHLSVAEIMVIRRVSGGCSIFSPSESWNSNDFFKCSKWFKRLSENRQIWLDFILQPVFPLPACDAQLSRLPIEALEAHVRRQFELARLWSPPEPNTPIRVSRSRRLAMPNNESLTAMSSMDSWVAVATDLGGIYVCAPFGKGSVKWIRVLSLSVEITKLRVTVWSEPAGERVGVLWAGCLNVQGAPLSYQCGIASALAGDLAAAQSRTQGSILLSSSDFVTSTMVDLRNPASEIMDIAIGERYCAVIDAAHIIQVFMHRSLEDSIAMSPERSGFQGPCRSSRKTISLQFLPCDQLLVCSDSFIAVYKPVSRVTTAMESKYWTPVPSTNFFGLITQHRSSSIALSSHMSVPIWALSTKGTEITHFDLRVASYDSEGSETNDYGLALRRSVSYLLSPSLPPFPMGTINGGHSRLVWIAEGSGQFFGVALGRICTGQYSPYTSYQTPLDRAALDLGEYGRLIKEHAPSGPLFVFHEGEGKLLGGVRGAPDLVMLEY
ncbi:hypothetical protein CTheo_4771 [Ceratobasidium theobromae]|uniref:F-box domain-containing protein n=1 Tax=Ceratobasidium theobromae TaxID=1582974 RepID=A0A5N5QJG0_9AGAM|nr:hypothetical protein CTheo_4771 [Ceratobasidium theobromae]